MNTAEGKPSIVVLGDWENGLNRLVDWDAIRRRATVTLHNTSLQDDALRQALQAADCAVLVRDRSPMPRALLSRLPRLRHIIFTGTRNKTLDLQAALDQGITVSHTDWGPSKASTCEMTWSLILAAARDERLSSHAWRMRMTRGVHLLVKRGIMAAPGPQSYFCSHIVSLWGMGVGLLHHIRGSNHEERMALVEARLRSGFQRLPISRWPN